MPVDIMDNSAEITHNIHRLTMKKLLKTKMKKNSKEVTPILPLP